VYPDDVTTRDLQTYILAASIAISPLDFEIPSTLNQANKERVWALVNSVSDPLTQMATTRTSEEIFYIKRLLDAMFETYNTKRREIMAITGMQASETRIRKGPHQSEGEASTQAADKGLTVDQVEKLLVKLVNERWIEKSREGFYRLAPRALMELRNWLVETYNDADEPDGWQRIKFCVACKDIVTVGQRCANLECKIRLHNVCEEAYWRANPNKSCPRCKTAWDGKHYVGQKVVTSTDELLREKRRHGGNKRSRGVEEEEDNEEDPETSSRRRRNRVEEEEEPNYGPSRRSEHTTVVPEPDSEGDEDDDAEGEDDAEAEENEDDE
jgi:hypothetical protein